MSSSSTAGKRKYAEMTKSSSTWQPFYLNKIRANRTRRSHGVSITDIVSGEPYFAVFMNYMVDQEWLFSECFEVLAGIPVLILHGQRAELISTLPNVTISPVDLGMERYGTHHSKMILLFYESGLRVCIGTANLLQGDYENKAQGFYIQDFPLLYSTVAPSSAPQAASASAVLRSVVGKFGQSLCNYLKEVKAKSKLASKILAEEVVKKLDQYDFSSAEVELIASVPGRHAVNRCQWGHIRVRDIMRQRPVHRGEGRSFDNLILQCSSLGSAGKDEKFLQELATSFVPKTPPPITARLIWPTVDFIRQSIDGYAAGGSVCCDAKVSNVLYDI
jgi:tyrosyl-DNA phosphodiesterase-1